MSQDHSRSSHLLLGRAVEGGTARRLEASLAAGDVDACYQDMMDAASPPYNNQSKFGWREQHEFVLHRVAKKIPCARELSRRLAVHLGDIDFKLDEHEKSYQVLYCYIQRLGIKESASALYGKLLELGFDDAADELENCLSCRDMGERGQSLYRTRLRSLSQPESRKRRPVIDYSLRMVKLSRETSVESTASSEQSDMETADGHGDLLRRTEFYGRSDVVRTELYGRADVPCFEAINGNAVASGYNVGHNEKCGSWAMLIKFMPYLMMMVAVLLTMYGRM